MMNRKNQLQLFFLDFVVVLSSECRDLISADLKCHQFSPYKARDDYFLQFNVVSWPLARIPTTSEYPPRVRDL